MEQPVAERSQKLQLTEQDEDGIGYDSTLQQVANELLLVERPRPRRPEPLLE